MIYSTFFEENFLARGGDMKVREDMGREWVHTVSHA